MSKEQRINKPSTGSNVKRQAKPSSVKRGSWSNQADLDYISTWDRLNYEPADAFMHEPEVIFEDGSFDVGEDYPRGV